MSNISTSKTDPGASPSDMTLPSPGNQLQSTTTTAPLDCKQTSSQVAALALAPEETFAFTACFLSFNHFKTYSPLCHLTLTGAIEATCCDPTSKTSIDILWPESLLRAPRIVVNIYLQDTEPTAWRHLSDFFAVYWFLESLAGFLGVNERLSVKIRFLEGEVEVGRLLHWDVLAALDGFGVGVEVEPEGVWREGK